MVESKSRKKAIPRFLLFLLPLIAFIGLFVYGVYDSNGRKVEFSIANIFDVNWRFGLTWDQTTWDPLLFFDNLWFNLFIGILMAGVWLYRAPARMEGLWKTTNKGNKKIFIASSCVAIGLVIAMTITMALSEFEWTLITDAWQSTHFAYVVPVMPLLLASMMLLVAPMKKYLKKKAQGGTRAEKPKISLFLLLISMVLWLVMALPTLWHPKALFYLEMHLFTWTGTLIFGMMSFTFLASFLLKQPPRLGDGVKNKIWKEVILFVGALAIPLLMMFGAIFTVPYLGESEIGGFWFDWWWPMAHWPGYVFSGAVALAIITGTRYFINKKPLFHANLARRLKITPKVRAVSIVAMLAVIVFVPVYGITTYEDDPPRVLVNQLGYLPSGMKRVLFQAPMGKTVPDSASFALHDASSGEIVHEGSLECFGNKSYYQHWYMNGSFTSFTTPGKYYVTANINGKTHKSHTFRISDDIYDISRERAVDFYYYQRCGYEVEDIVEGYYGHYACHLDDALVYSNSPDFTFNYPNNTEEYAKKGDLVYKNLTGGWHDAGDYNKYNSWYQTQWFCVHALNYAWEMDDESFYDNLANKYDSIAPDILDEALWGANFLAKCVDTENLQGWSEGLIIDNVQGWNWKTNKGALMSYNGPPENDDQRLGGSNRNSEYKYDGTYAAPWGYSGVGTAWGFAGVLLETARIIDEYAASHPVYELPSWSFNTTYLRDMAYKINDTYYNFPMPPYSGDFVSRLTFEKELALMSGNWTNADKYAEQEVLGNIYYSNSGWGDAYELANLLAYYYLNNRTAPANVTNYVNATLNDVFSNAYLGPFNVLHELDTIDGVPRLYGSSYMGGYWDHDGLHNHDFLGLMYLQVMASKHIPANSKIDLLQYQLDYLFGMNPLELCQMDGVGGDFVEQIHHRYAWAGNPTGRIPGGIINGLRQAEPTKDWARNYGMDQLQQWYDDLGLTRGSPLDLRWMLVPEQAYVDGWPPCNSAKHGVDSNSNEIWIPHNAFFLHMMSAFEAYHH
ncbi:MAG: glycoside hydrolase family 9 protein [Candidatus Hodarchaeota archaeon]